MKRAVFYWVAVVIVAIVAIAVAAAVLYVGEQTTVPKITARGAGCEESGSNAQYSFTLANTGVSGFADVGLVVLNAAHSVQSPVVNGTYFVSSNSQAVEGIIYGYTCLASGYWSVVILDEHW